MNTAMEKNQELIINAIKRPSGFSPKASGRGSGTDGRGKRARCESNKDDFEDYMDEIENLVHDTQKTQDTPLDRGSLSTTAKSRRVVQSPD
eukprot:6499753-Ditylum_brightwellii.AAC.1